MQEKNKLKPTFRLAEDFLDLRTQDTNLVVQQLEEQIKLREMPLEKHIESLRRLKRLN